MAKLTLRRGDEVVKHFAVGPMASIGRTTDNAVVIDSPGVSSHHACVFREGGLLLVEDLQSTNGTFLNGRRVSRHVLRHGDVVQVGGYELVLDESEIMEAGAAADVELAASDNGATVFIDKRKLLSKLMQSGAEARKCDALMARLRDIETHARVSGQPSTAGQPETPSVAVLRVLAGRADQDEYALEAHTSLIGKSKSSLVRLRGWFKPHVAVAITRNRQGYVATFLGGDVQINSQPVRGRHELKDGDFLDVSGLTLEFRSRSTSSNLAS
jgi:pSer/pThr/pTyr-binding forkhead associated (FHA) protein